MEIDILIKKPMAENDVLKQIISHIQANYSYFQNQNYFIKLEFASEQLVKSRRGFNLKL